MSAAAILSVAARKAASEGKKVGAAALTLIALVVMSLTVFPGLNRAPADQMAEAPTSQSEQDGSGSTAVLPAPSASSEQETDFEAAASPSSGARTPSPSPSAIDKAKKQVEEVLEGPSLGGIMNSDNSSTIFVLDQDYTAVGDNGLTAKFTFNPTKAVVFSNVLVEITLEDLVFDFRPTKPSLIEGKSPEGLDVYIFTGTAPYLFDEFGKKWDQTASKNATFKLEVIMEAGGTGVKEIRLALYSAS
jgi:hypothetical protein